jgi:hypothetical protein
MQGKGRAWQLGRGIYYCFYGFNKTLRHAFIFINDEIFSGEIFFRITILRTIYIMWPVIYQVTLMII